MNDALDRELGDYLDETPRPKITCGCVSCRNEPLAPIAKEIRAMHRFLNFVWWRRAKKA